MSGFVFHRWLFVVALLAVASSNIGSRAAAGPSDEPQETKTPSFATIIAAVHQALTRDPEYRSGDLLSASQVSGALAEAKRLGWQPPDNKKLLERIASDDEFLVTALKSERGTPFMRQVSKMHNGYDRVDRMSRMPQGRQTVEKLIQGPDGYKLIEYMTTSKGGKEMGAMLGRARDQDFNGATGRIYTEQQLLDELKRLYSATAKK
jgi:hypothetical protein